ncbi:MAG: TonB-dependent receptor [Alphaproteobacteria bacterium]
MRPFTSPLCLEEAASLRRRLRAGTALGLAMSCLAAAPAAAQSSQPASASGAPVQMPTIQVEADTDGYKPEYVSSPKYTEPLRNIPQSITIITTEQMKERGATSISEALRTTPGISLGAGEGGIPFGDRAFIRGFDARSDMFIDGTRDFGAYSRDPYNVEQVEVVKGPSSTYSGRGSTGGTINLATKQPTRDSAYGGSVSFGTDWTKRSTIDINQSLEDFGYDSMAFRLNAMVHDADVAGRDEVTKHRWAVAPSFAWGLGTDTRLIAQFEHLYQDDVPDYGVPFDDQPFARPLDVDRDNFYGILSRDKDEVQHNSAGLKFEHDFSATLSLTNQLRYTRTTKDFIVTKPEYTAGANSVVRSDRSRDSVDSALVNQTDVTTDFNTGEAKHTLVAGMELSQELSSNQSRNIPNAVNAPLNNPDPHTPYNDTIAWAQYDAHSTSYSGAVYAFDTIKFGQQWELSGGLRYDRFKTDYRDANLVTYKRNDDAVTWRIGTVYKPYTNGSIYFAYGTSINPSAEGLTLSATTSTLEPEESESYELGTKWDLAAEKLALTAALFRTNKTNARTSTGGGGAPQVLSGEQRVEGLELGVTGHVTDRFRLMGGYTYMQSEILTSLNAAEVGKETSNTPRHTLSLWGVYQVTEAADVGAGAYFQDERYANTSNSAELPSYWRFDATAGYRINEHFDVRVNALNLTDATYYDSAHSNQHALVAPGRSFLLTGGVQF